MTPSRSEEEPEPALELACPELTPVEPGPGHEELGTEESDSDGSDHDLIRRAQAGDEYAFADLLRRHERRAWRVARNLVPGAEDASDLVQEAFLRVFRSLDRFDFQHEFTTWLYRIVTNLAIDHLRKRRPAVSTAPPGEEDAALDLPDEGVGMPSDNLERAETAALVRACIESLAPHFQAVLVLRELEGLPCTEIARIVGATHVTVRWRLHRGRKLFQEEWERRLRLAESGAALADAGEAGPGDGAPSPKTPANNPGERSVSTGDPAVDPGREPDPPQP